MKKALLPVFLFSNRLGCKSQQIVKYENLKYESYLYQETLNKSFINKRILFLSGSDSIFFNIKIPFEIANNKIYDPGIFYNCTLKEDSLNSFVLKKVSLSAIPKEYNSYYVTNGVFSSLEKSKFTEIRKDTKYQYQGNNGMFIDIDHELYLIEKMVPADYCVFRH